MFFDRSKLSELSFVLLVCFYNFICPFWLIFDFRFSFG